MSVIFNGNSVSNILYNGEPLSAVYYNDVKVFPDQPQINMQLSPFNFMNAVDNIGFVNDWDGNTSEFSAWEVLSSSQQYPNVVLERHRQGDLFTQRTNYIYTIYTSNQYKLYWGVSMDGPLFQINTNLNRMAYINFSNFPISWDNVQGTINMLQINRYNSSYAKFSATGNIDLRNAMSSPMVLNYYHTVNISYANQLNFIFDVRNTVGADLIRYASRTANSNFNNFIIKGSGRYMNWSVEKDGTTHTYYCGNNFNPTSSKYNVAMVFENVPIK